MNKRLAVVLLSLCILSACSKANFQFSAVTEQAANDEGSSNSSNSAGAPPIIQHPVYKVLNTSCLSCHAEWKDFRTDADWTRSGLVTAGNPSESILMSRLKYGTGLADMPYGFETALYEKFSQADYDLIKSWIQQMLVDNTSGPGNDNGGTGLSASIRLGDRVFVSSFLRNIFGPSSKDIVIENITKSVVNFGGPCDPRGGKVPTACVQMQAPSIDTEAPILPVSDSPREGLRMKACRELVFNDATLYFAVSRVSETSSPTVAPTDDEIESAFELFFPGRFAPAAVLLSLKKLSVSAGKNPKTPEDPWRYLFLTLCYAPDWQAL